MESLHRPFGSAELDLLIEDLGLIPSSLITPSLQETIIREFQLREFEIPDYERMAVDDYLTRLERKRSNDRKRIPLCEEQTFKINF